MAWQECSKQVVKALESSGFLLITSHYLPRDLQRQAIQAANHILQVSSSPSSSLLQNHQENNNDDSSSTHLKKEEEDNNEDDTPPQLTFTYTAPAIDANGQLTFETVDNTNGSAVFSVILEDYWH